LDKLSGSQPKIIVRRAKEKEEIVTIDGVKRVLNKNILVIANEEKPVAIAGVMGGKDTEVTVGTENILLEAAVFNPIVVRRGRQQLGIQSDSSYRFERGVNSHGVEPASLQAVKLIQDCCSGRCVLAKSAGLLKQNGKAINFEIPQAQKILGLNIPVARIKQILNNLDFKVSTKSKNILSVGVPHHRQDVYSSVDLIEEIARVYGYENFPTTLPVVKPQVRPEETRGLITLVKNTLAGLGLNEVITYSLVDRDILNSFGIDQQKVIEITNPLSKEQEVLRPAITPGLLRCIAYNLNQKQNYVFIFEVAKSFAWGHAGPKEELVLGIGLCGVKSYLLEQGLIKEEASVLQLKGVLETLFSRLGIKDYSIEATGSHFEFGIVARNQKIGTMAQPQKVLLDGLGIKNKDIFVLELSLDKLMPLACQKKKFSPWPKFPAITRDISFVLNEDISIEQIWEGVKEKGASLLREIKIVDYYKGKQIPDGSRALTISCLYCSDERTLTEEEINPVHSAVSAVLTERFGAKIR
jgi:phenylalanyl-tRNA synthetase beta chain